MVEGVLQSSPEGTPQGGPLSPLLANILLDDLDKELERRGLLFVRYADDFMIFTKTRRAAERVFCAGEADETVREPRPVDSAASADVLLETLAVRPHAGPESLGARSGSSVLRSVEPRSADPHATWCGGRAERSARLPDSPLLGAIRGGLLESGAAAHPPKYDEYLPRIALRSRDGLRGFPR